MSRNRIASLDLLLLLLRGAALCLPGLAVSGCDVIRQIALQTAPHTEKVAAEFNRLPNHKVLVLVWVPPEVKWDYPHIRLDIAAHVSAYLEDDNNIKNVTVVDPRQVEAYLNRTTLSEIDPVAVGQEFRADMVVHLAVYHFSVRDPGMAHYYRGRLASTVEIHDLTAPEGSPQRYPLKSVEVVYPEKEPVSFANARPEQIRAATYQVFATAVGRKFHDYERPMD